MRGVITGLKSHSTCFYFITGEDGKEYYSRPGFLAMKKSNGNRVWDKFVWNGNGCEFDPKEDPQHVNPVAMNVVPDEVIDPRFNERKANRLQDRRNQKANAERKEANRKKSELLKAEAGRLAEVKKQYKTFLVQCRTGDVWKTIMPNGVEMAYDTLEEAKAKVSQLKRAHPDMRFRVRDRWKEIKKRGREESN